MGVCSYRNGLPDSIDTSPTPCSACGRLGTGYGSLEHVGRRSGRSYRTPLTVFTTDDGVAILLTYGPERDWLKNITAAGGGRLRRHGHIIDVRDLGWSPKSRLLCTSPAPAGGCSRGCRSTTRYCSRGFTDPGRTRTIANVSRCSGAVGERIPLWRNDLQNATLWECGATCSSRCRTSRWP